MGSMFSYSKTAMERAMKVRGAFCGRWRERSRDRRQQKKCRRDGLWKRRGVEKSKNRLSHPAWKSRKPRGIPTLQQPRRLLVNLTPDKSRATKTGHFNLLRTPTALALDSPKGNSCLRWPSVALTRYYRSRDGNSEV